MSTSGLHSSPRQAFTLIELLVVIAIIAILAVVVLITLNPAQLLAQSRDANRVSDLATMQSAINLYVTDQTGSANFSLGLSSTTYISIPDPNATTTAGTDCSDMSTNFTAGGYFACPASSTYRDINGTGWIPINFTQISAGVPFGSLPVDPVNTTSSNEYYSYQTNGSTFRLSAVPESQKYLASAGATPSLFTAGSNTILDGGYWVPVPGNSQFGTGDFYVMKYEAVCSDGNGNVVNSPTSGNNTYLNLSEACTPANSRQISSLPGGYPIVDISQTTAASYCASIGAHLITNNEWQTIAWNAENVASNWSGGSVGSGTIYSGHNDDNPATASVASSNDSQNCVGTDGPASCGGTGTSTTQIRTLTLSNGSIVWDLAGNVGQWTSGTIIGSNEPNIGSGVMTFHEFTAITSWGTMTQQTAGPANSTWYSAQGVGKIESESSSTDSTTYGIMRGGRWQDNAEDGVGELNLSLTPTFTGLSYGFRCAR